MARRIQRQSLKDKMDAKKARQAELDDDQPQYDDSLSSSDALRDLVTNLSESAEDVVEDIPMADILADNAASRIRSSGGRSQKVTPKPRTRQLKKRDTAAKEKIKTKKKTKKKTKRKKADPDVSDAPKRMKNPASSSLDALIEKAEADMDVKTQTSQASQASQKDSLPAVTESQLDMLMPGDAGSEEQTPPAEQEDQASQASQASQVEPTVDTEENESSEAETVVHIFDVDESGEEEQTRLITKEDRDVMQQQEDDPAVVEAVEPDTAAGNDDASDLVDLDEENADTFKDEEQQGDQDAESVEEPETEPEIETDLENEVADEVATTEDAVESSGSATEQGLSADSDNESDGSTVETTDTAEPDMGFDATPDLDGDAPSLKFELFDSGITDQVSDTEEEASQTVADDNSFVEVEKVGDESEQEYPFEMEGITEEIPELQVDESTFDNSDAAPTLKPSDYDEMGFSGKDVALSPDLRDETVHDSGEGEAVVAENNNDSEEKEKRPKTSRLRSKTRKLSASGSADKPKSRRISRTRMNAEDGEELTPRRRRKPKEMDLKLFYGMIIAMVVMLVITAIAGYLKFFKTKKQAAPIVKEDKPASRTTNWGPWSAAERKFKDAVKIANKGAASFELEDWTTAETQFKQAWDLALEAKADGNAAIKILEKELGKPRLAKKREVLTKWQRTVVSWRDRLQISTGHVSNPDAGDDKKVEDLLDAVFPVLDEAFAAFSQGVKLRVVQNQFPEAIEQYMLSKEKYNEAIRMAEEILAENPGTEYNDIETWRLKLTQIDHQIEMAKQGSSDN